MKRFLILLCLLTSSPLNASEPVHLTHPAAGRRAELTVLYSVFTQRENTDEIRPEMIRGFVNSQLPQIWNGEIARILGNPDQTILSQEEPPAERMADAYLQDFGRELREADRKNLQSARRVIVCGARGRAGGSVPAAAAVLAYAFAQQLEGTLLDPVTLECFSPAVFYRLRLKDQLPRLASRLITRPGPTRVGVCRLATRGMRSQGLPDLVLEAVPEERLQEAHIFLIGLALRFDALVDAPPAGTEIRLQSRDLAAVAQPGESLPVNLRPDGSVEIVFLPVPAEPWDDRNRQLAVRAAPGQDTRSVLLLNALFARDEPVFDYLRYSALAEIAQRARNDLPALTRRFREARPGEEFFLLIVPPLESEADNLIWVRVSSLTDSGIIRGVVMPDQLGRRLQSGDSIDFNARAVFDWLVVKNGQTVGGDYLRRWLQETKKSGR